MNMRSHASRALCAALLTTAVALMPFSVSAKMYKWTDAEGNVHYTQTPPPASAQESKSMKVQTGSNVRVRKRGKNLYCGDQRLPRVSDKAAVAISNLENNILGWEDNIERTREQLPRRLDDQPRRRRLTQLSVDAGLQRELRPSVEIEAEFEWPQGGRSIYFRDPAGNSVEFAEPRIWGL